jgi:hypothetical protein
MLQPIMGRITVVVNAGLVKSAAFQIERFDNRSYIQPKTPEHMLTLIDRGADASVKAACVDLERGRIFRFRYV